MVDLDRLTNGTNPFNRRGYWHGRLVSVDGTATDDFTAADVAEVVAEGSSGDQWDGTVAAVLRGRGLCGLVVDVTMAGWGEGVTEPTFVPGGVIPRAVPPPRCYATTCPPLLNDFTHPGPIRCKLSEGHEGPHFFYMEWTDPWGVTVKLDQDPA